ncbi:hypothetical protein J6590_008968 [Homalodisca vitripennis]|nr:hypothetical protein J6590_008968 [Homalodisca vitripennis]
MRFVQKSVRQQSSHTQPPGVQGCNDSVLINSVILDAGSSDSWPRDMITWVQRFEILNLRETEANRNDPARTKKCPGVLL